MCRAKNQSGAPDRLCYIALLTHAISEPIIGAVTGSAMAVCKVSGLCRFRRFGGSTWPSEGQSTGSNTIATPGSFQSCPLRQARVKPTGGSFPARHRTAWHGMAWHGMAWERNRTTVHCVDDGWIPQHQQIDLAVSVVVLEFEQARGVVQRCDLRLTRAPYVPVIGSRWHGGPLTRDHIVDT